jgi:hypothetical protein
MPDPRVKKVRATCMFSKQNPRCDIDACVRGIIVRSSEMRGEQ